MNISEKKWIVSDSTTYSDPDSVVNALLATRGIDDKSKQSFLKPMLSSLTLESVGIDSQGVRKAIKRIKIAIDKKEQIIVYGDYDVDGITGAAILWETLYALGGNVLPYIPHRVDEGYGLSEKGIQNLLASTPPKLIITVDNGIVAHTAVDFAKKHGIDVIITDHHVVDGDRALPDAHSFVHTTKLCGSSVALLFSKEIKDQFADSASEFDKEHLILAALATVADLVSLTQENRTILMVGLKLIRSTERIGLRELLKISGLEGKEIGVYEIGHIIAPRLNAAGRIESGMDSLRLLCTKDSKKAQELASALDEVNKKRQILMKDSALLAIERARSIQQDKKIIIVDEEEFEEGIIGLVAGKLVEEFYKPSIAIAKRADVSKGSVRSVSGVNIIEMLRLKSDLFINAGGHPMAAGFTVKTSNIEIMKKVLESIAEEIVTLDHLLRAIKIDLFIPLSFSLTELYGQIQALAPFGMGNPEPLFLAKNVIIRDKRIIGKDQTHVRFVLSADEISTPFEAIAFGMAEKSVGIEKDDTIDIAYTLDTNTWNDVTKLQLKLRDFRRS
ncbi:MAG: single-stranded-DNA-specific exonuclease RecJ [Candidatus Levybacteria bacterium]|nr:single-stranded-DNA-specific exonuclease RecJ [Candidatus Levybacteria bacterium]